MQKGTYSTRHLTQDAMFMVILVILGMIKLPSFIPGAEFQLSAPYAVCLAMLVGFKRYFCIGIAASALQLMIGTHTIFNVIISLVFRIVAGLIATKAPFGKKISMVVAGPLGTACGRFALAAITQVTVWPLLAAAVPGMLFTAVTVLLFEPVMRKLAQRIGITPVRL